MSENNQQRILNKIAKCLALAKSSNPHEANIAWRQAMAMMKANNITKSDVVASGAVTARCDIGVRPSTWIIKLANTCARAFSCQVITERSTRQEAVIIGIGTNPELAAYTFAVLHRQLSSDRRSYVSAMSARCKLSSKRRQAEIFAEHWINSVWNVIARFAQMDEATTEIIAAYLEKRYPKLTTTMLEERKVTQRDYGAAHAGLNAGANAKIHRAVKRGDQAQLSFLAR